MNGLKKRGDGFGCHQEDHNKLPHLLLLPPLLCVYPAQIRSPDRSSFGLSCAGSLWQSNKAAMCAEVLVLDSIPPTHIKGVYVSCEESKAETEVAFPGLDVVVNPHLFFRQR